MSYLIASLNTLKFISEHPLNKNHRVKAVFKFLKWQIATRLLKMKVVVPWVDDSIFISGIGETGLTGNIYTGLMEYEDMLFLLHALQPEDTFVDVGANVGAYTILASRVVGSKSISFEPLPDTINRLKDQLYINRIISAVDLKSMGVGDKQGTLFFTNNNDTTNKVSIEGNIDNTSQAKVTTLDHELKGGAKFLIKIDVEGYEFNALKGASHILSSNNVIAVIIELNGSGEQFGHSNEEIHQLITDFDFTPVSYDPLEREITKLASYNKNGGNTIYVKEADIVANRCKSAPVRRIHTAFGATI